MANSLRARIKQLRYIGKLMPHQERRIINALDFVDHVKSLGYELPWGDYSAGYNNCLEGLKKRIEEKEGDIR